MAKSAENSIGVSVGITKNLGNFNSLKLDAWQTAVLADGEDVKKAYETLWREVKKELEAQLDEAEVLIG